MSASGIARFLAQIVLIICTVVAAAVALVPAASAQPPPPPTAEQIFEQLGVDQVPADYVVLVDTSLSMGGIYGQVVDTLRPFLAGTTALDRVVVYTFDSSITRRYTGPGGPDTAAVSALPPAPSGGVTDIGSAISSALTELEQSRSRVGSVVMLTDGVNNPPFGSPYGDVNGSAWGDLSRRAAALRDGGWSLQGYALPLSGARQGAELLRKVIPGAELTDLEGVRDIAEFLDRTKRGVRARKAEDVLAADADGSVVVEWPDTTVDVADGQADVPVTLRSTFEKVPVTVSGLTADVTGVSADVVSFAGPVPPVDLAPGQSATVTIPLRWSPEEDWWPPFPHTVSVEPTLTMRGTVGSSWTDVLRSSGIALAVNPAPAADPSTVRLEAEVGWLPLFLLLLAVAVLLVVLWRVRAHRRAHPEVSGRLSYRRLLTPDQDSVALQPGRTDFTFPSSGGRPPGVGSVRAVRTAGGAPALRIEYTPDGTPKRRTSDTLELADGGVVTLGGVEFRAEVTR